MFQFSQALKSEAKVRQSSEFSAIHKGSTNLKKNYWLTSLVKFITKRPQELDRNVPPPSGGKKIRRNNKRMHSF